MKNKIVAFIAILSIVMAFGAKAQTKKMENNLLITELYSNKKEDKGKRFFVFVSYTGANISTIGSKVKSAILLKADAVKMNSIVQKVVAELNKGALDASQMKDLVDAETLAGGMGEIQDSYMDNGMGGRSGGGMPQWLDEVLHPGANMGGADGSYYSEGSTKTHYNSSNQTVTVVRNDGNGTTTVSVIDRKGNETIMGTKNTGGPTSNKNENSQFPHVDNSTPNPEDWKGFGQASLNFYMSNRLFKNIVEQWIKGVQAKAGGAYGKQFSDEWSMAKIMYYDAMLGGYMMKTFNRQMAALKGKYGGKLDTDKGPNILDATLLIDGAIDPRDPNAIKAISQGVFKINGVIQK